jgi:hypothetical protein
MKTEERIEKLERELAELKKELKKELKPEFEVGKWYIDKDGIYFAYEAEKYKVYFYGIYQDEWRQEDYWSLRHFKQECRPATDEEVKEALIEEAKRRGFKEGVIVKTNNSENSITRELESANYYGYDAEFHPNSLQCGAIIFENGEWSWIIQEPKVIINGHEMKQDGDIISFGCGKFNKEFFIHLYYSIRYCNGGADQNSIGHIGIRDETNRKIKSITLDSDVKITVEQLKQIVDNLK